MIVEKQTDPDGSAESFEFDPGAGLGDANEPNFNLTDGLQKAYDVDPGTYSVQELAKANWDLTSIVCSDAPNSSGSLGTRTASFNVQAGETVKCTFTNRKEGKVIVEKQTDPDGSSASFAFDPGTGLGDANEPNFNLTDGPAEGL